MTQTEVEDFIQNEEIVLESTSGRFSFKSNLFLIKRNFDKIRIRLTMLHRFIVYVYNLIDIDSLTTNVINNLANNKLMLAVDFNLVEGTSVVQQGYIISRLPNNQVNIERQLNPENWNVERLIVAVKNVDGQFIYPSILTRNNKIELYFLDGISSNYKVFFI